jgi:hypothetical protein
MLKMMMPIEAKCARTSLNMAGLESLGHFQRPRGLADTLGLWKIIMQLPATVFGIQNRVKFRMRPHCRLQARRRVHAEATHAS